MFRVAIAAIIFLTSMFELAYAGDRIALVVGASKYEHAARLVTTVNDATDVSAALRRLGFEVETVLDPSRSEFEAAVRRYGERSVGAQVSVFHYSGHGLEARGRNWLLPVTFNANGERDLRFEAIDLTLLIRPNCDFERRM